MSNGKVISIANELVRRDRGQADELSLEDRRLTRAHIAQQNALLQQLKATITQMEHRLRQLERGVR